MRYLIRATALAACFGSAAAKAAPAPTALPTPLAKDVQCFTLYASAAGQSSDDKTRSAASAGTMYYLGKIDAEAPRLDLVQAIREQVSILQRDGKAIAEACGAQLSQRGKDLTILGGQLQKSVP